MHNIIQAQKDFQKLVGTPMEDPAQTNFLSEIFLFKAIEEIIELRKEFPSGLNKRSKTMKQPDEQRLYEELSDVVLFLLNFMIVRGMTVEKLLAVIKEVQLNNTNKVNNN
jgi:NTP pyrophosphatase (non-canonical NTP hydrolase)